MAALMSNFSQYLVNGITGAELSPMDRGFAYGDGVFRTLRVCLQDSQPQPGLWALHYKKLSEDCNALAIDCPSAELLLNDIRHLFRLGEEAVAKIIITRGEGHRGYAVPTKAQPTRVVIKTPLPQYPVNNIDEGVRLHLCHLRLSAQPRLAGVKHLNRLENIMARMEWTDSGIAEGVLLDEEERAIECTTSNIFVRFNKTLVTPDLSRCGVAGITRSRILEIAPGLGLRVEICDLSLDKLMQADEILVCNSLYGVWQATEFNNKHWQQQALAMQLRHILQE